MKAQHFPGKEWRVGSEVPGGGGAGRRVAIFAGWHRRKAGLLRRRSVPPHDGIPKRALRRLRQIPQIGIDSFPLTEPIQTWYC
jgi:hypothetical protein